MKNASGGRAIDAKGASLELDDLIALNDEILSLVRAGVPIDRGLMSVGGDLRGQLARVATELGTRIDRGESLSQALEAEGSGIPPLYRAVVAAGLRSGRLTAALEGLADYARGYAELRRVVGMALIYPVILFGLTFGLFAGYVLVLFPRLIAAFESFRLTSGPAILALDWLRHHPYLWVPLGPLALIGFLIWWIGSGRSARLLDSASAGWFCWIPWMGGLLAAGRSAQFSELLLLLVRHGVTLPEALRLSSEASASRSFRASIERIAADLELGRSVSDAFRETRELPPLLSWAIATGAEQGRLEASLVHAVAMYRRRVIDLSYLMRVGLPSLMMVAIGGTTTLLYVATLFLPFTELLYDLSQY